MSPNVRQSRPPSSGAMDEQHCLFQNGPHKSRHEGCGYITIGVPTDIQKLGFTSRGLPPDDIIAYMIDVDGWADTQGIESGDKLIAVNGQTVNSITVDEFKRAMSFRPLELEFNYNHPRKEPEHVQEGDGSMMTVTAGAELEVCFKLGFTLEGVPPNESVVVSTIAPAGWAEQQGIRPGDVLVALNGRSTSKMTGGVGELNKYRMVRPLTLDFVVHHEDSRPGNLNSSVATDMTRAVDVLLDSTTSHLATETLSPITPRELFTPRVGSTQQDEERIRYCFGIACW